jgi:uncharacterized damage-inducible protein DinB
MSTVATTFTQTYQIQFNFHFDETQRLLRLARALPDDVYRAANGYSRDGIHNTFAHLLGASQLWRNVIANREPVFSDAEERADIDALARLFEIERTGWLELVATFDADALFGTVERQSPFGTVVLTIWQTLQHMILHGMAHHTELARMLTEAGQSPDDIDFLFYETSL